MKKFKKLLAGLLAGAMMLGSMTTTAFAEENTVTTPVSTIDTTKKGSLTINKYEGTDPDTAKPLSGVEFTIYKIAAIDQETTRPTDENPYTEVKFKPVMEFGTPITSSTTYKDIEVAVNAAVEKGTLTETAHGTTMDNAEKTIASVTFDNLELGVYLVVETDAPSQIVNRTANFLVSIPMAKTDKDGNTVGWEYNVTANPKNSAVYGGIVLQKEGKTLNTDGEPTTIPLSGIKFKLQKKESDDTWTDVDEYTTEEGIINIPKLAPGTYKFVELGYAEGVTDTGYIIDTTASYEFTVADDGTVDVAKDENNQKLGNIDSITTSGEGANIRYTFTVINEKPKVDKVVMDGETEKKVKDDQVGDTVTWKVKASVPEKIASLKTYQLVDQLSKGLTVENGKLNMVVKADATTGTITLEKDTDYTVSIGEYDSSKGTTIIVDFTNAGKAKLAENKSTLIEVTFNSTLTKDAVIGNAGNPNDVTLKYSNTTDATSTSKPEETQPSEIPAVFTYALDIYKFCKENEIKTALAGAEFTVYGSNDDGTINESESGIIAVGTSGADGKVTFTANEITLPTGEDPNAVSVKSGIYYIKETKAPAGYNLLKDTIKVEYSISYSGKDKLTSRHQTATVTIVSANGTVTDEGHLHYEIENKKGFTLPSTGGMGTVIFSVLGIALVLAGLLVITASRKKAAK